MLALQIINILNLLLQLLFKDRLYLLFDNISKKRAEVFLYVEHRFSFGEELLHGQASFWSSNPHFSVCVG